MSRGLWVRVLAIATAGSAAYHLYTGITRPAQKNLLAGVFQVVVAYTLFDLSDVGGGKVPAWQQSALEEG